MRAGAASRDITPALGGDFFGYVRPDIRARGVALRLSAHALVLDDGERRVGLLALDLGAPLITDQILARAAPLGFTAGNLLIAATHTHAGPNKPGEWIAAQAADALREADASLQPAAAGWAHTRLEHANQNRSMEAHLANHGMDLYPGSGSPQLDPDGADHTRDLTLRLLRVDQADGAPLAAWAHFSVHPTTFSPANTLLSADFPGVATRLFRQGFTSPPVAMFSNGTEGDLIPVYDECNQHACADRMGRRVADAMRHAWDEAKPAADLPVAAATETVRYAGQEVAPGRRVARRAWFGLPFIGGAANGPSFFFGWGVQGMRRPRVLADRVHGRKVVIAPAPWPPWAEVTAVRIGDRLLLGVPGEPSVEAGRRMCAAALQAAHAPASGAPISDALVVGLAQRYRGYFTTPEEYEQQHYEGGHTVFGKHTSAVILQAHERLATRLSAEPLPGALQHSGQQEPVTAVAAPVGRAPVRAQITRQPPSVAQRFEVVGWSWRAAPYGHDRPVGQPYLSLQIEEAPGRWRTFDDDLGTGFVWSQHGTLATGSYEVPADLPLGRYRMVIGGGAEATATSRFEVCASDGLRLRGAVIAEGSLRLLAQNPPPDPLRALRARDRSPSGGTVRFRVHGVEQAAQWDSGAGAWCAPLDGPLHELEVPAGGLVDAWGNTNREPATLAVGHCAPLDWPPAFGPGGGRCPGPFLLGPAGKPAPWPA